MQAVTVMWASVLVVGPAVFFWHVLYYTFIITIAFIIRLGRSLVVSLGYIGFQSHGSEL